MRCLCVCGCLEVTLSLTCYLPYFRQSSNYYSLSSLLVQKQFCNSSANPCRIKVCQEWFSVCVMDILFYAYFPFLLLLLRTDCLFRGFFPFYFCIHRRCRTCLFSSKTLLDFTLAGKHWRHGRNIKRRMSENLQISLLSSSVKHEHAPGLQIRSLNQVPHLKLNPPSNTCSPKNPSIQSPNCLSYRVVVMMKPMRSHTHTCNLQSYIYMSSISANCGWNQIIQRRPKQTLREHANFRQKGLVA